MDIQKDDYVEGYEFYGTTIRKTKGWVDSIRNDGEVFYYNIQADDEWNGARGTILSSDLGKVEKLKYTSRP